MSWTADRPDRWAIEKTFLEGVLTNLSTSLIDNHWVVEGSYSFSFEAEPHGPYKIRIRYPLTYPYKQVAPDIYLMSHEHWMPSPAAHFESTRRLCLFERHDSKIDFTNAAAITKMIGRLSVYLTQQEIYQRRLKRQSKGGPKAIWPGPERPHGDEGTKEVIDELIAFGERSPCSCKSGRLFKNCHGTKEFMLEVERLNSGGTQ